MPAIAPLPSPVINQSKISKRHIHFYPTLYHVYDQPPENMLTCSMSGMFCFDHRPSQVLTSLLTRSLHAETHLSPDGTTHFQRLLKITCLLHCVKGQWR